MKREMTCRPLCCLCLCVFAVMLLAALVGGERYADLICKPVPPGNACGLGEVESVERNEKNQKIFLKNVHMVIQGQSSETSRIIVYDKSFQEIEIGDRIEVRGEVFPFESNKNPGEFNARKYYRARKISGGMWGNTIKVTEKSRYPFAHVLSCFRRYWSHLLKEEMGEKNGAVLSAILLGDKSSMENEVKSLYRLNGIGHILAISGLHLSFLGMGIYQRVRLRTGSYTLAMIVGIVFLGIYIMMIGESLSAMRALIMFLFKVGAQWTGRKYDSPTALSAAAALIAVWRPLSVTEGAFWLSFGAVAGMLAASSVPARRGFRQLGTGLIINVVMMPVQICQFFIIPLYGALTNCLVIPLMSVLLGMGLLGSALLAAARSLFVLRFPARVVVGICSVILTLYEKVCQIVLQLPASVIAVGHRDIWQAFIYYACLLGMICVIKTYRGSLKRRVGFAFLLGVVGITALSIRMESPGKLKITMLDMGQGDGFFIQTPSGRVYMIDGGSSSRKGAGQYIIEPFLLHEGKTIVDYWFLTHGDEDHISAVEEILGEKYSVISIKNLVLPPEEFQDENLKTLVKKAEEKGVRILEGEKGDRLVDGRLSMECLWPVSREVNRGLRCGNQASMVFHMKYGDFDMLFTGDLEGEGERELVDNMKNKKINWEVLKVAHHGSENSTSEEFLQIVNPSIALISAGEKNPYGHPHEETLNRIKNHGGKIWDTRSAGAVKIIVDDDRISIDNWNAVHLQ